MEGWRVSLPTNSYNTLKSIIVIIYVTLVIFHSFLIVFIAFIQTTLIPGGRIIFVILPFLFKFFFFPFLVILNYKSIISINLCA